MRLIDADALNLDYEVEMADDWKTAHEIANHIKYAPTVEAIPVVHCKEEVNERGENMAKQDFYYVPVEVNGDWNSCKYRKVSLEELDELLDLYRNKVLEICRNGEKGVMAMWAFFKNTMGVAYTDMANAYDLLTDDHKSLVDREHELRHEYNHFKELHHIRYYGSVEEYHLVCADNAKKRLGKYTMEE